MVLLAAAAGAVDAMAFTALGHVFAGVMTGNLALLGLAAGGDHLADVVPPLVALAGFAAGTAAAARACRGLPMGATDGPRWPPRVLRCLAGEAALLTAAAIIWATSGAPPTGAPRDALLCTVAAAMGTQSAAILASGPTARPSTYLTGALTTFITRSVGHIPGPDPWVPARLAALATGAATAAAVFRYATGWTAFLPPVLVVCAVAVASRA